MITTALAPAADPKVLGYCEAQYDYSPMETNQIAFKVGERIAILSKSRGNRGWWKGRLDGKVSLYKYYYYIYYNRCYYTATQVKGIACG